MMKLTVYTAAQSEKSSVHFRGGGEAMWGWGHVCEGV